MFPLPDSFGMALNVPMRVLVVEDDKKTVAFIRKALQAEGFAADSVHHGGEALAAGLSTAYDAIVLDIMLPGPDGLSVLRQLRERRNNTPVLLLSARGGVNERIDGLNAGADDYLAKPFELGEMVARVRALCRRSVGESRASVLQLADLTMDTVHAQSQAWRQAGGGVDGPRISIAGISVAVAGPHLHPHDVAGKGVGLRF